MGYTYDDPDQPEGYWAGRWAECKRLWLLFWDDPFEKARLYLAVVMFFGALLWGLVDKYT